MPFSTCVLSEHSAIKAVGRYIRHRADIMIYPARLSVFLSFFLGLRSVLAASVLQQQPILVDHATSEHTAIQDDLLKANAVNRWDNESFHIEWVQPDEVGLDPLSKQFSGYLQAHNGKKLFFWLFLSESSSQNDPLILWLNGGPGCSSLYGALRQWGPKVVNDNENRVDNPFKLNDRASLLFIDNPIGVGFSTGSNDNDPSTKPSTTPEAVADLMAFLTEFFAQSFPVNDRLWIAKGKPFHIGGQSYSGHFIANLASTIVRGGKHVPGEWNLESLFIGNGWFDAYTQAKSIVNLVCSPEDNPVRTWPASGNYPRDDWPPVDPNKCTDWHNKLKDCQSAITACRTDTINCPALKEACDPVDSDVVADLLNKDQFDLTKLQYPRFRNFVIDELEDWVQGMGSKPTGDNNIKWEVFRDVGPQGTQMRFLNSGDWARSYVPDLGYVLTNSNVRVLLYAVRLPFPPLGTPPERMALLTYRTTRVTSTSLPLTKGSKMWLQRLSGHLNSALLKDYGNL